MTMNRFTSNTGGSVYGFAQVRGQSGFARNFNNKFPAKNLFFASAWSFPGGGYTGTIIVGFLTARVAEKRLNGQNNTVAYLRILWLYIFWEGKW